MPFWQYACQFRPISWLSDCAAGAQVVQSTRLPAVPRQSHFSFVKIQFGAPCRQQR